MLSAIKNIRYLYIRIVLALLVLAAGGGFVLTDHNFDTDYNKAGTFTDIKVLQMQNGDVIKQEVRFDHTTVHSIGVSVVNRTNVCDGIIEISLIDDNGNEVWSEKTSASDFKLQKVKWYRVKSEVDVEQSYLLYISAVELDGLIQFAGLASEDSAEGADSMVLLNNEQQEEKSLFVEMAYSRKLDKISRVIILVWTIVIICHICGFELLYVNKRRGVITVFSMVNLAVICAYMRLKINFENKINYKIFAGIIFLIAVAIILAIVMLLKGCKKVELYFILYAALFGILYSILLPPFSAPDEDRHYLVAYRISNAIMMQKINDPIGYIYMRQCDTGERIIPVNNQQVIDNLTELLSWGNDESKDVISSKIAYNLKVPITLYIPQALGITMGRILRVGNVQLVYCGRLMNLLFFVAITAMAIRLIPYGKWIIFAICQIPIVMELVTSYSYDTIILAMTFLIVAYILKKKKKKESASKKQLWWFAIICIIYAPLKPVYIPVIAIMFMIPNKKINVSLRKSVLYKAGVFFAALVMTVGVYKYSVFNTISVANERTQKRVVNIQTNEWATTLEEALQIEDQAHYAHPNLNYLIENPFDIIESYAGALINLGDELLLSMFGKYLSWYDVVLPTFIAIFVMGYIYLSFTYEDYSIIPSMNFIRRCWVVFMIFGICVAVLLTFYLQVTVLGRKMIYGVQGRYFIPALIPVVFLLRGRHKKDCDSDCNIVMMASIINIIVMMEICSTTWY